LRTGEYEGIDVGTKRLRLRDERGQGLVEFALVGPLLFALIIAVIDFGNAWKDYETLQHAVSATARACATARFGSDASTVFDQATKNLGASKSVSVTAGSCGGASGSMVTVQGTYPFDITIPLFGKLGGGTLTSTTSELNE
jgi:Flp pilus assembly protein TadG